MLKVSTLPKSNLALLVIGLLTLALSACGDTTPTIPVQPSSTTPVSTTAPTTTLTTPITAPTTLAQATATPILDTPALTAATTTSAIETGLTARANVTPTAISPVELLLTFKSEANPMISPFDITLDEQGNLYVIDGGQVQIYKFDKDGQFVTKWGGKGSKDGQFQFQPPAGVDGPSAGFISADKQGRIYVSDAYNYRIQVFDSSGKFLYKFGSQGTGDDQFAPPVVGPVQVNPDGTLFIDAFDSIKKFDSSGKFLAKWGSAGNGPGQFTGPGHIGTDKQGNYYVTDLVNHRVQKFDSKWQFVAQWDKNGQSDGKFNEPVGLAIDSKDHIFVTDNTNRVQIFDTTGKFLGKWDSPTPAQPKFNAGIVIVDAQDNIYVSDCGCGYPKLTPAVYKFRLK